VGSAAWLCSAGLAKRKRQLLVSHSGSLAKFLTATVNNFSWAGRISIIAMWDVWNEFFCVRNAAKHKTLFGSLQRCK
jgi:hypothetical protein